MEDKSLASLLPKFCKLLKQDELPKIFEAVAYGIRCLCSHILQNNRNFSRHDSDESHPLRELCWELFDKSSPSSVPESQKKRPKLDSTGNEIADKPVLDEQPDKLAEMLAGFLSSEPPPSQGSVVDLLSSQETLSTTSVPSSHQNTPTWWDPRKRKAYRVSEGVSEECEKFIVQAGQIFVQWPSGELTATNYPAEFLVGNQIRSPTRSPAIAQDVSTESSKGTAATPKKKPSSKAVAAKAASSKKSSRPKSSPTSVPKPTPKASSKRQLQDATSVESHEYRLMFYKSSNKHAIRKKNGRQLFQHRSLTVVEQSFEKLQSGSSEDEVIQWAKSQR